MLPDPDEQPTIPVWPDAAKAFGLGRSATYEAIKRGDFPCKVILVGNRYRAITADARRKLELDDPQPAA